MIETKTSYDIWKEIEECKNNRTIVEEKAIVWVCLESLKKEMPSAEELERDCEGSCIIFINKLRKLCNSQEQEMAEIKAGGLISRQGVSSGKLGNLSGKSNSNIGGNTCDSVSCEHKVTGGDKPVNSLQQVKMQNRSSPVQNPKRRKKYTSRCCPVCNGFLHKENGFLICCGCGEEYKECTCPEDKFITIEQPKVKGFCGRCGGVL